MGVTDGGKACIVQSHRVGKSLGLSCDKEKNLMWSKLNYIGGESETIAVDQLTEGSSHAFYVCWNFGLVSEISQAPLGSNCLRLHTAAHGHSTGADLALCGPHAYPRADPLHFLPPLCP